MAIAPSRRTPAAGPKQAPSTLTSPVQPGSSPEGLAEVSLALSRDNLDTSVAPGENFYQFANGGWLKSHPIAPDKTSNDNFSEVSDRNTKVLLGALNGLVENPPPADTAHGKLARYFASGMDEAAIEKAGLSPLQPLLSEINRIDSRDALIRAMAHLGDAGASVPLGLGSTVDMHDSKCTITGLFGGGLGLSVTNFRSEDEDSRRSVQAYRDYAERLFQLLGDSPEAAKKNQQTVLRIEQQLANATLLPVEARDPAKRDNPTTLEDLSAKHPSVPWSALFEEAGLSQPGKINVPQPALIQEITGMLDTVSLEDWKVYLRLHLALATAPYLGKKFEEARLPFMSQLYGTTQLRPRQERVLGEVSSQMGDATGRIFVEKTFPPESKAHMLELVENLRFAMEDHIRAVPWMTEETRARALEKLAAIRVKIGYPEKWEDYAELELGESYAENHLRAVAFQSRKDFSKIGKAPDPNEWHMNANEVNAYYAPNSNEIVFPAGILQPPFFDPRADDAVNYGSIGTVIAHEITHGFDDKGARFDADGNLNNWWAKSDAEEYAKRVRPLVEQFNAHKVGDVQVNGQLTLGENIADLSGMALAFDAYQKSLVGKKAPVIDGFTGTQRFFLAFATTWRSNDRLEALIKQVKSDPHSPPELRTNIPLANSAEFQRAFKLKKGDPLALPEDQRVVIW